MLAPDGKMRLRDATKINDILGLYKWLITIKIFSDIKLLSIFLMQIFLKIAIVENKKI